MGHCNSRSAKNKDYQGKKDLILLDIQKIQKQNEDGNDNGNQKGNDNGNEKGNISGNEKGTPEQIIKNLPSYESNEIIDTQVINYKQTNNNSKRNIMIDHSDNNNHFRNNNYSSQINESQIDHKFISSLVTQYQQCINCESLCGQNYIQLPCLHIYHQNCYNKLGEKALEDEIGTVNCICTKRCSIKLFPKNIQYGLLGNQAAQIFEKYKNSHSLRKCNDCLFFYVSVNNDESFCPNCQKIVINSQIPQEISNIQKISAMESQLKTVEVECQECKYPASTNFLSLPCQHRFHNYCLIRILYDQIITHGKQIVACTCGRKIHPIFLRTIDFQDQLHLKAKLFQNQLNILFEKYKDTMYSYDYNLQEYQKSINKSDILIQIQPGDLLFTRLFENPSLS